MPISVGEKMAQITPSKETITSFVFINQFYSWNQLLLNVTIRRRKYQVEPLQLLPGISLHDLSIIRACASKRQIPPSMKDLLLITLRVCFLWICDMQDHLENLQKRKASITQNYAVMSKYEDEIGFRRQRDVKEILRLHSISEAVGFLESCYHS